MIHTIFKKNTILQNNQNNLHSAKKNSHSTPKIERNMNYLENLERNVICWKYGITNLVLPNIKSVNVIYPKCKLQKLVLDTYTILFKMQSIKWLSFKKKKKNLKKTPLNNKEDQELGVSSFIEKEIYNVLADNVTWAYTRMI